MSLAVAEDVSLFYGSRPILEGASFRIGEGERIGLIGPNGTGKSTLLKVLAGEQGIDGGRLNRSKSVRVGYLTQDVLEAGDGLLLPSILSSVPGRAALERREHELGEQLDASSDPDEQTAIAGELAELHHELAQFEVTFSEAQAKRILAGLGFGADELDRPVSELSGGWRMRAALAALLFQSPDLLLLDEPTNHLDLDTVTWLADFLREVPHALVLVSHDREFLDRQVDRILSFEPEGLRSYAGNFQAYLAQRTEEERVLEASARNQDRERKRLERFIDSSRSRANTAKLVQSRVKKLEKLDAEKVELRSQHQSIRVRFPPVARTGKVAVELRHLQKAFGDLVLYRDLSTIVTRGERVALVGRNGAGKTTLLRIVAGDLEADGGEVVLGSNAEVSYYAQHLSQALDRKRTILDEVATVSPEASAESLRGILGAFLFQGDDVDKRIGVLSGGERARVALAKILVRPGNVLLLDEPTNHLDTESAEVLAESLEAYEGTIVFVSHNLSFARRLATRVWDLVDGRLLDYPGTLDEFLSADRSDLRASVAASGPGPAGGAAKPATADEATAPARAEKSKKGKGKKAKRDAAPAPAGETGAGAAATTTAKERKAGRRQAAEQRKALSAKTGPLRKKIAALEEQIGKLETEQGALENLLANPDVHKDSERYPELCATFEKNRQRLTELYTGWERRQSELAEITGS